jgi:hypothetical protein
LMRSPDVLQCRRSSSSVRGARRSSRFRYIPFGIATVLITVNFLDYHHDALFPSSIPPSEIIKRANAIWARRGIKPKQHLSEQRPGAVTLMERRAHADRCESLPVDLPDDMGT